jgi:hypothetical protein
VTEEEEAVVEEAVDVVVEELVLALKSLKPELNHIDIKAFLSQKAKKIH